jgi:hypothetical protein
MVIQPKNLARDEVDDELRNASATFRRHLVAREYEALRVWLATVHADPVQWQQSAFVTQNVGWCTAEELAQLAKEVSSALDRFVQRVNDPASRPPESRAVRFLAWGIPAQPLQ